MKETILLAIAQNKRLNSAQILIAVRVVHGEATARATVAKTISRMCEKGELKRKRRDVYELPQLISPKMV